MSAGFKMSYSLPILLTSFRASIGRPTDTPGSWRPSGARAPIETGRTGRYCWGMSKTRARLLLSALLLAASIGIVLAQRSASPNRMRTMSVTRKPSSRTRRVSPRTRSREESQATSRPQTGGTDAI